MYCIHYTSCDSDDCNIPRPGCNSGIRLTHLSCITIQQDSSKKKNCRYVEFESWIIIVWKRLIITTLDLKNQQYCCNHQGLLERNNKKKYFFYCFSDTFVEHQQYSISIVIIMFIKKMIIKSSSLLSQKMTHPSLELKFAHVALPNIYYYYKPFYIFGTANIPYAIVLIQHITIIPQRSYLAIPGYYLYT